MSRKLLNLSIISVLMLAALTPAAQGVQAQEPPPGITVNVTGDWIEVWGLDIDDLTARLEVLRGEGSDLVCSGDYPVIDGNPWLDCPDSGIQAGDLVTLEINNVLVNEHIVPNFTIDVFVQDNSYFRGKGPLGEIVSITVCNPGQTCIQGLSTVDQDGIWEYTFVDVSVTPYHFWATIWDGVNSTQANYIPPPTIEVNHTTDWLSAWGFTSEDHSAQLEVYSPTSDLKCSDIFDLDESWDISLDCQMQGANILPGDLVILEVDGQQVNELLIQPVFISEYNPVIGFIRGTAPETAYVQADICNEDGFCISGEAAKLGEGAWEMLFDPAPFNYVGWVAAHVIEPDGDHTIAEYFHPVMDVNIIGDWISAWGFGPEAQFARLEVWRGTDLICDGDFDLSEGDPWLECWQQDTDILPGDLVLLIVDGAQVKDHTVFDLTLDEVNTDEGYFAGTAPMETTVRVDVCNPPDWECISQEYTTWPGFASWEISFGPGVVDPDAWFAAFIVDPDGDQTMAEPVWAPQPWFTIHPEHKWAGGIDWPIDVPVTLTIDDDNDHTNGYLFQETLVSWPADWDPNSGEAWFDLESFEGNLDPGLYVSMTDEAVFKDTWIVPLRFDALDPDTLIASGSGPEGGTGMVCLGFDYDEFCQEVFVWTPGEWTADFSQYELDLDYLMDARVVIWDEDGDETMANLPMEEPPPLPAFSVQPDHGWVCTGSWPIDVPVTLTIAEDDSFSVIVYQETKNTFQSEWDPNTGEVCFDFYDIADDVLPGMYVTVSDGITTKDTWILDLSFDVIDPDMFIAHGTGPGGGIGHACIDQEYDYFCHEILISSDGSWEVDFSGDGIDLSLIDDAHVVIYDEDGDETMAHLDLDIPPQPFFNVNLSNGIVHAIGWPLEDNLSLIIDDPSTPEFGDYSDDGVVFDYTSYDPNLTLYDFIVDDYEILPGFLVQVSGSEITKEHIVTSLTIANVDYETNMAFGTAYPNSYVGVFSIGQMFEYHLVNTGAEGNWIANFSFDIDDHLIVADEGDEDGDNTEVVWFPNSPPAAEDDFYGTDEDVILSIESSTGVLSNDTDPDNDSLEVVLLDGVQYGNLVLNTDGSFSYTPDPNYFGADSFSYRASDGSLESEIAVVSITINPVNDVPQVLLASEFTINEGQSFFASGSFSDPDQDGWTGTVDYFSEGVDIQPLTLNAEKSFNLSYDYPADDGSYSITVTVDDGQAEGSAVTTVTVLNVSPSVTINSIAAGDDFAIVGLSVHISSTFFDPGDDTHTAVIEWGDGSQAVDPAFSPLAGDHIYQSPGQYTVTVTVTDDDGGVGFASVSLDVVEPADAAEAAIAELGSILEDPGLDPEAAAAIEEALVNLEGANDGLSSSGALDKIDGGQWNAALVKINKAIQYLEDAQAADPTLDLSELIQALVALAEAVALEL